MAAVGPGGDLTLLNPEWQGCGVHASVHAGATALAAALAVDDSAMSIDAPVDERLHASDGVLGLASIAPRFRRTLDALRHRAPDRILHIGGTCGAELAPVAYLNEHYGGALAVVWLDAHGDLNTPASSPSGHFHGMALRTLLGHGPASIVGAFRRPLTARQVFLAGTRDLDPPEAQFVTSAGLSVTTSAELQTPQVLVDRIRAAGFGAVYAHLDLDVLDPSVFPDSLMQTPGGLSPREAAAVLAALHEAFDLVGFSVVEYVPRSPDGLESLRRLLRASGIRIAALASAP